MISYELAKQLKDAGFPQVYKYGELYYSERNGFVPAVVANQHQKMLEDHLRFPTLSELIEACGDKFKNLYLVRGEWFCNYHKSQWKAEGKTPEEAVAKLLLELKK